MTIQTVTLSLSETTYIRLQQTAKATKQSLTDVLMYAVKIGSPPGWEDTPAEFQADLAALDRLPDQKLWQTARSHQSEADMKPYQELLNKNANGTISEAERLQLIQHRTEADRFMLRKSHAAALLRWRGHQIPPSTQL